MFSKPESIAFLRQTQRELGIILPSDYIYLLLHQNAISPAGDEMFIINDEKGEEMAVIMEPIFDLAQFQRSYKHQEGNEDFYFGDNSSYFCIGVLSSQGALLIGAQVNNQNKIYVDSPNEFDRLIQVSDNIFDLFENRISLG